jgi:altronate hydrolase
MSDWIQLHPNDHVVIALRDFQKGEILQWFEPTQKLTLEISLLDDVLKGHKILIRAVAQGADILKFGYSIGKAKENLQQGSWVHTHNIGTGLKGFVDYSYQPDEAEAIQTEETSGSNMPKHEFMGYLRENGEAGIRNEIWVLNTVGCINKTCEVLARRGAAEFAGRVDGVYNFPHPFGCSQLGDDLKHTQKLLASLVNHPNAAGVLIVGLGCENNQIDLFKSVLGDYNPNRIKFMKSQEVDDELEAGLALIEELVVYAEQFERQPISISQLKVGLKCGGSDGLSGITANPLVGAVSDLIITEGGTTILTEVPEMFGAETILMNRAANEQVFDKIVHLINDFKQYFIRHDQEIYENPSPGNKAGGISTLEEKSLGCTQKGGHAIVTDVVPYGQRVTAKGLNLLEAPGNDLVSVTALAAAGAHIVLFTTGRGTPFGGPVPTVKISSNSELASRKKNWIDFNAGQLIEGAIMEELKFDFLTYILDIASGEQQTKNESNGFREIAIFKDGVIL